jgi:hypothetical protein
MIIFLGVKAVLTQPDYFGLARTREIVGHASGTIRYLPKNGIAS